MSCLKDHKYRLFDGKLWVWVNHRDPLVRKTLEPLQRPLRRKQQPDFKTVHALEQLGKLIVISQLPYRMLDAAYERAGISVVREPGEPQDIYRQRHRLYCTGEAPLIESYIEKCAVYLPRLYAKNPPIEWMRPKLEPLAAKTAHAVAEWYEACRAQE